MDPRERLEIDTLCWENSHAGGVEPLDTSSKKLGALCALQETICVSISYALNRWPDDPNHEKFITYGVTRRKRQGIKYFSKEGGFVILEYIKVGKLHHVRDGLEHTDAFSIPVKDESDAFDFSYFGAQVIRSVDMEDVLTSESVYFVSLAMAAYILDRFSRDGSKRCEDFWKRERERRRE